MKQQQQQENHNLLIQPCLDLFTSLVINDWKPEQRLFSLLYKWLTERSYNHIYNRFARILLTKIGWNRILVQNDQCLMIPVQQQQQFSLKLYQAMEQYFKITTTNNNDTKTKIINIDYPRIKPEQLMNEEQRLRLAQSIDSNDYGCWCWSMLLSLRLHPLDLIPDESSWDDIVFGNNVGGGGIGVCEHLTTTTTTNKYSSSNRRKHWTMQYMMKFNYDSEMIQIAKGIESNNPYAIYIAAISSDLLFNSGYNSIDLKRMTELNDQLISGGHLIPTLQILYHFLPFCFQNDGELRSNQSFILSILTLLQNDSIAEQLSSIILLQRKHFQRPEFAQRTLQSWTECLFETINRCLNMKISTWFSTIIPQFLQSSSTTNQMNIIDMILGKITSIFDRLSMELLLENGDSLKLYQQYLFRKLYGRMMNWKFSQLDLIYANSGSSSSDNDSSSSSSWLSSYWYSNETNIPGYLTDKTLIRSPWMTPFHLLLRHCLNSRQSIRSRQPVYLIFLLTEIDIRRTYQIWNHLVLELRKKPWNPSNEPSQQIDYIMIETEITKICLQYEKAPLPYQLLPLNLLTVYLLKLIQTVDHSQSSTKSPSTTDRHPHPIIPLLWRQFFSNYFLYTDSLSTIGNRFIDQNRLKQLNDRLNSLFDYHNQRWIYLNNERSLNNDTISIDSELFQHEQQQQKSDSISTLLFEDRLVKLYRAYRIWLKDNRFLQYADLDDEQFAKPEIQIKLLNSVVSVSSGKQFSIGGNNNQQQFHFIQENFWPEFDHLNSFFMLNYVHKTPLQSYIFQHEQSWIRLMKPILQEPIKYFDDNEDDNGNDNDIERKLPKLSESSSNEIQFIDANLDKSNQSKQQKQQQPVEYSQSERFGQIIDYFSKLTSSLNCNILFIDNDIGYNLSYVFDDHTTIVDFDGKKSEQDISIVFVIIHQIVDNIIEEARFVEQQLEKFNQLNSEFCKDILPKLYHDVSRDLIEKISCDRSEFDANGCTKPAIFKFEFTESLLNNYIKQKLDRNRAEFDQIIKTLIDDIPGQKQVASIYFMQKIVHYLLRYYLDGPYQQSSDNNNNQQQQQRIQRLFETMSGWINSINLIGIKYHLTGQLLDIFLDLLQKLSVNYVDEINYFYLNTVLQRSVSMSLTQQLAPCLQPSKTSTKMFIEMYKLIGSRLNQQSQSQQQPQSQQYQLSSPAQTIFVLLSKFDVSTWLQLTNLSDEQRLDLLQCLFQCFQFFGPYPSDDHLVIYDLYRKHLQDMILYRFPIFMANILANMLTGMNEQKLAPILWNSILHTRRENLFGQSLMKIIMVSNNNNNNCELSIIDFDYQTFDDDLRIYVLRQKLFTSHELYNLLQLMLEFKHNLQQQQQQQQNSNQQQQSEFLDHFKIYNVKFLQFLTFISYCWINSNATTLPDDLSIIWLPFFENWRFWLFPRHNTKFIQWEHFCFAWQLFINSVQYMLDSFYDDQPQILSCLWQPFMTFILETRSVERTDVEMFESKLLQLKNWSQFYPSIIDMKLMYESVVMERYSIERLNSFVISKIQWNQALLNTPQQISFNNVVEILENLTYTIISLVDQPYIGQVDFFNIPFWILPSEKIQKIIVTLLEVMKKRIPIDMVDKNLDKQKSTDSIIDNQLIIIMRLLKSLVQLQNNNVHNDNNNDDDDDPIKQQQNASKVIYYGHCIGSFVSYQANQNSDYLAKNPQTLLLFLKDSIESLRPTIDTFDTNDRVSIFCELLQSLNEIHDQPIRDQIARHFVTIFSYMTSSQLFTEIIFAVGKIIYSIKTAIYLLECLLENYFDLAGDLQYLIDNLEIVHMNKQHLNVTTTMNNNSQANLQSTNNDNNNESTNYHIEDFMLESIRTRSCLLLLIYIHRQLQHRTVPDICTRRYVYSIMIQCVQYFGKFGQQQQQQQFMDESKQCFFWTRIFDLLTFDHSSISNDLPIFIIGDDDIDDMVIGGGGGSSEPTSPLIDKIINPIGDNDGNDGGGGPSGGGGQLNINHQMELLTKQWIRYYIRLSQHQQQRFHLIQRWLLELYNDHNYMKHFI
ncbi:Ectopic P granules protein 5 [Dermatophagoides pteronyssinus]|uniref:Ectopic P granules protein 5 n=1 Tax=Dermatophagoides pteronyssinus TaxID=6956 RepID=A0ABQ8J762_DERPT|nr:Ectopic P granules protein 5 [Dermatophagoides pteronyssinus]